jgi:hypothetical protein
LPYQLQYWSFEPATTEEYVAFAGTAAVVEHRFGFGVVEHLEPSGAAAY